MDGGCGEKEGGYVNYSDQGRPFKEGVIWDKSYMMTRRQPHKDHGNKNHDS